MTAETEEQTPEDLERLLIAKDVLLKDEERLAKAPESLLIDKEGRRLFRSSSLLFPDHSWWRRRGKKPELPAG